ncbi:MAG: alpha/beta fold hydrolase [Lautropia sp.]|nr:alpha/beta fold hydrolase [Lautropia sp.]
MHSRKAEQTSAGAASPISFPAADGYTLRGHLWRHPVGGSDRPVVIINPATSVKARYYWRFADHLHARGMDVLTYDYRGIGESRHGSLRQLQAGWVDWGEQDLEGALQLVKTLLPERPIHVVAHSVGGLLIGLAPSAQRVSRIFTMGAQFAWWQDYAKADRRHMFWRWHVMMPTLARLMGYVPAKRLGWMEDTPKGVALSWARMKPRLEDALLKQRTDLLAGFSRIQAPILALSASDDPFGTERAIERLLAYYAQSDRHHLRLSSDAVPGQAGIGHFAFFHQRFEQSLWPLASNWLLQQQLPTGGYMLLRRFPAAY